MPSRRRGRGSGRLRGFGIRRLCRGRPAPVGRCGIAAVDRWDAYERDAALSAESGEVAFDVLFGALPQFSGEQVPHDLVVVVVAVQAERLAEAGVAGFVAGETDGGLVVRAQAGVGAGPAGVARLGSAVAAAPVGAGVFGDVAGVYGAEGRGGEGGEDGVVGGDGFRDAFAADEERPEELVGVALVGFRARGADRGAAVAAGFVDVPVGQVEGASRASRRPVAGSMVSMVPDRRIGRVQPAAARTWSSQPK